MSTVMYGDGIDLSFGLIRLSVYLVAILSGLIGAWRLAARRRRAESWPMLLGYVERAEVNNEGNGYTVTLAYSYQVNGEFLSGFYSKPFKVFRFAGEFVSMSRGQQLFVRYDPEKPEISVIRDKDNAALLALR